MENKVKKAIKSLKNKMNWTGFKPSDYDRKSIEIIEEYIQNQEANYNKLLEVNVSSKLILGMFSDYLGHQFAIQRHELIKHADTGELVEVQPMVISEEMMQGFISKLNNMIFLDNEAHKESIAILIRDMHLNAIRLSDGELTLKYFKKLFSDDFKNKYKELTQKLLTDILGDGIK